MSIKICLIAPFAYKLFYPDDNQAPPFGGAEVQQYQLACELAEDEKFAVHFMTGGFGQNTRVKRVNIYHVFKLNRRIFIIDALLDFLRLYRSLKKINPDVVLIRGGGALAGKTALLVKKILKKKFIFSSMHDRESNGEFFKKGNFYKNFLFKYGLKMADVIICQHNGQKRAFKKNFNLEAVVIRSMHFMTKPSNNYDLKSREFILWVGRLESWKQPEIFAELAKKFSGEKFLLITNQNTVNLLNKFKSISNLKIIKNAPFEEIDKYFQQAKVFVNTSIAEGFPNTFVQAAKNGTPIISLNVNPDNLLEEWGAGRCARGDIKKLQNDLAEILADSILWKKASDKACQYARENHDIEKIVRIYKELFLKLCV